MFVFFNVVLNAKNTTKTQNVSIGPMSLCWLKKNNEPIRMKLLPVSLEDSLLCIDSRSFI